MSQIMDDQLQLQREQAQKFNFKDFIFQYIKYVPWIAICVIISLVLGYIKLRYSTRIYSVESSLLTDYNPSSSGSGKFEELFSNKSQQKIKDQMEILKSRPLMKRVVKALNLQTIYVNKGKIRSSIIYRDMPFTLDILQLKDSGVSFTIPVRWLPNGHFILEKEKKLSSGEVFENSYGIFRFNLTNSTNKNFSSDEFLVIYRTLDDAAESLVDNLKVKPVSDFGSNIVELSLATEKTQLGEDVLNRLMEEYANSIVEDKNKTLLNTLRFIEDRLRDLTGELGSVEGNLQVFREKNDAFDLESQSKAYIEAEQDNVKLLTEQEVRIRILDYLEDYLHNAHNNDSKVPTNLGIVEPVLLGLMEEYNKLQLEKEDALMNTPDKNPLIVGMNANLNRLRQSILETLHNVRASYVIVRDDLLQKYNKSQGLLSSVPGKSKQLLEIARQQKIKEELYLLLASKKEETAISLASTIPNSKVVEPAKSSPAPVSPNSRNAYLIALLIGIFIPLSIILIIELLNDKIKSRSEIERMTDTPIIGEVSHSDDNQSLVARKNNRHFIAEQFRVIRTNLQYLLKRIDKPIVLVTSSFSGEGKSFITTNLGAVMALAGKKTVIVELDIRKPKVMTGLKMSASKGISNYIIGGCAVEELPVAVPDIDDLYVVPCGPIPPNPSEMLLDEKFKELFSYLRSRFDFIVVDSAPVGMVSDPVILGAFADATLYIVRHGYTYKKQINMIDELHNQSKLPNMGVIINDIRAQGMYGYGYSSYGYGYGYGYGRGSIAEYLGDKKVKKGIIGRIRKVFRKR